MSAAGSAGFEGEPSPRGPVGPSGLLDLLNVASIVLDAEGRIVLWSPQAEELFGYSAREALGRYAARIMVHERHFDLVVKLFEDVMRTGRSWAGAFPVRHKDGSTRLVEFRNMRLLDDRGDVYALGLAADQSMVRRVERDVALFADIAAVDLLDAVVEGRRSTLGPAEPAVLRALAVRADDDAGDALRAADPPGRVARYGPDRLVTECVRTGRPVMVARVTRKDLERVARSPEAAELLHRAGVHSYLAVPLIARGEVLGALDLKRIANPVPFDEDDLLLARELAARAALQIDNARWYQNARDTALTLQRSLLPSHPPVTGGLEVASRYQPAGGTSEVGGDWFDVIELAGGRTALVVGDVMGSGIAAAASMGRLRTATNTLAALELDPAQLLGHLERTTAGLDQAIATCLYAVHDPHRRRCLIANAGHLPPVRLRAGRPPELLDLPTGVPLGVGGVAFATTEVGLEPGDRLVFYTDGLVETRRHPLDERLDALLALLEGPDRPLEEVCDLLLRTLHEPENSDDVALLIARATPPESRYGARTVSP
ncbi:SpoIIE family protein phosphatase [Streptomyces sp. NPDC020571]|uniref:SpoIIE family protein phosphatase n=1 Tax=Streptomyces sp. NPDC020571 TaxID=3365079 RepID=UPI0037B26113